MSKLLTSISIILALCAHSLLPGIYFSYSLVAHHLEVWAESEYQEETVLLVEDIQQLHWKSNQHEFEYRGKLYDYKSMRYDHGKPVITCVYDAEEEELLDHFSSQQHHNLLSITLKLIFDQCVQDIPLIDFRQPEDCRNQNSSYSFTLQQGNLEFNAPPPDGCGSI